MIFSKLFPSNCLTSSFLQMARHFSGGRRLRLRRALLRIQAEQHFASVRFCPAVAGRPFYVTDESGEKTYAASVGDDGTISNLKLFAEQGGESVAADSKGNVYIAAGRSTFTIPPEK